MTQTKVKFRVLYFNSLLPHDNSCTIFVMNLCYMVLGKRKAGQSQYAPSTWHVNCCNDVMAFEL